MAKRICLLTSGETDCKDNCFNCDCGGAEATKDMYVSINNVQRVCAITGGAADTDEGEYIAEVIRNNLENMVIPAADVQPIVYAHKTINVGRRSYCSNCGKLAIMEDFCSKCGAKVKGGDTE